MGNDFESHIGAATARFGEKRTEDEFGSKIPHENENILSVIAIKEPKHLDNM